MNPVKAAWCKTVSAVGNHPAVFLTLVSLNELYLIARLVQGCASPLNVIASVANGITIGIVVQAMRGGVPHDLRARIEHLTKQRDELQVQVTEWELTAVREGLLCRGDIEQ